MHSIDNIGLVCRVLHFAELLISTSLAQKLFSDLANLVNDCLKIHITHLSTRLPIKMHGPKKAVPPVEESCPDAKSVAVLLVVTST